MQPHSRSRLSTLLISAFAAWLLGFPLGGGAPLVAGVLAGLVAPRRGAFLWAFLGASLSWAAWFAASAATAPLLPLASLLGAVVGIGRGLGLLLPWLAVLFAGLIAGLGSAGVSSLRQARRASSGGS